MTVEPNSPATRRVARNNIYGWPDDGQDGQDQDLAMLRQLYPGGFGGGGDDDPLESLDEGTDDRLPIIGDDNTASSNINNLLYDYGFRGAVDRGTPADAITATPTPYSSQIPRKATAPISYREATQARADLGPPSEPGGTSGALGGLRGGSATGRGYGSVGLGAGYAATDPLESPTGDGPLPTSTPPPPAARLQPPKPVDRAALYQQLRPYPGMSRSEKMQRMLSSAFHSAAEPGTGNTFKDAARAYAHGIDTYLGIGDYEKATTAQYAGQVISQIAAGEEYWLKYYDKLTEGEKRGAEGQRALAYADYLRQRGAYYRQRGINEGVDSNTKKIIAETARDRQANAWHNVPEGGIAIRGKAGEKPETFTNPKYVPPTTTDAKLETGKKLVAIVGEMSGGQLSQQAAIALLRAYMNADPKAIPAGSTFDKILGAITDPDRARGQARLAEIRQAGSVVNSMRPPPRARVGEGLAATARAAAGNIADILQFNSWKYTNQQTGEVDWEKFIKDARANRLDRDPNNAGQRNVRANDLATAVERMRRGQVPTGTPDSVPRTNPQTPARPAAATPGATTQQPGATSQPRSAARPPVDWGQDVDAFVAQLDPEPDDDVTPDEEAVFENIKGVF